jgi:hypothetical protein
MQKVRYGMGIEVQKEEEEEYRDKTTRRIL